MAHVPKQTSGIKTVILEDGHRSTDDPLSERVRSLRLPPEAIAGNPFVRILKWVLALGLIGAVAIGAYIYYPQIIKSLAASKTGGEKAAAKPAASPHADVTLSADQAADSGNIVLESKGYIIPTRQILVSPKISGMIVELNLIEGQRVKEGEALAKLEDIDYLADRDRAKEMLESARRNLEELQRGFRPEEIAQAKAELAETQYQLDKLKADFQRNSELFGRKMISKEGYDDSYSQYMAISRRMNA